jgi:hypothetical protein
MCDITVELLPVGRVRYAVSSSVLVIFSFLVSILAVWGIVTESLAFYHGKPMHGLVIFGSYCILAICGSVTVVIPYNLLRQYPILRATRLEVNFGGVSLIARDGTVLAEIKRATADRTNPGEVWFRNRSLDSDSFEVPLYLIPRSQRAAFLTALGLQHWGPPRA